MSGSHTSRSVFELRTALTSLDNDVRGVLLWGSLAQDSGLLDAKLESIIEASSRFQKRFSSIMREADTKRSLGIQSQVACLHDHLRKLESLLGELSSRPRRERKAKETNGDEVLYLAPHPELTLALQWSDKGMTISRPVQQEGHTIQAATSDSQSIALLHITGEALFGAMAAVAVCVELWLKSRSSKYEREAQKRTKRN